MKDALKYALEMVVLALFFMVIFALFIMFAA